MKILFQRAGLTLLGAGALIASPVSATAAGFDCSKAATAIEVTICTVPALTQLDDRLGALYKDALTRDPQVRETQRDWLNSVRNRCGDQTCLTAAYEQRIAALEDLTKDARSQAAVPATDPLAVMMDATYFYGVSELSLKDLMSNPNGVLFEKKIVAWTDKDFALLEQQLREQIEIEREAAVARRNKILDMGYTARPVEDDNDYSFRKGVLDKVIASIPKYKYLAGEARKKDAHDLAEAEAKQQQLQAERAQEEAHIAAAAQLREQQQAEAQAQTERSNKTWIVLALVAAAIGGWVWNKFIRLRCARCKSTSIDTLSIKETDRWRGTKQVTEKNSRGTNTRHVSTTFVKNRYHYECRDCGEDWAVLKKEEL